jgi:uncharacterized protein YndB with AHSA1/START domain
MQINNQTASSTAHREIAITRVLDAPRELVYEAWTKPEHVAKWWGPNGFTNTVHHMELKPEGEWKLTMHGPDGTDYPNLIIFKEIVAPEKLVYIHGTGDEPLEDRFHVTVTFKDLGHKTELSMRMLFKNVEKLKEVVEKYGALDGARENANRMEQYVLAQLHPNDLIITRELNAPQNMVYKAWTEAQHMAKWWGPVGMPLEVIKFDFQPGGLFHYSMTMPNGNKMYGRFKFEEMQAPEKLIFISSFADAEGNIVRTEMLPNWPLEILNTLTLSETHGKTFMVLRGKPINATAEELQAFENNKASMVQGFGGTFAQLVEYLSKI